MLNTSPFVSFLPLKKRKKRNLLNLQILGFIHKTLLL